MEWRKAADAGARCGLAPAPKDRRDRGIEQLRARAEKAEAELARTRAALDPQATHPARTKPERVATRAGQVWSWDITKLRGPERGVYYDLYVVLDIFSRFVVDQVRGSQVPYRVAGQDVGSAR